jgi:hypothetical protein
MTPLLIVAPPVGTRHLGGKQRREKQREEAVGKRRLETIRQETAAGTRWFLCQAAGSELPPLPIGSCHRAGSFIELEPAAAPFLGVALCEPILPSLDNAPGPF